MNLINLSLIEGQLGTKIEADAVTWDLHNAYTFKSFTHNVIERTVSLEWAAYQIPPDTVFRILFYEVDYLEISPRDPEIPDYGEDLCLDALSRVDPKGSMKAMIEYGVPQDPEYLGDNFHLLFKFRGEQHIRIGAKSAQFRRQENTV